MEVLGICYMDGVPLEICTFSFENDPDRCEDQFQREIVDCWRAVFQSNKNPILLTLSRTCCVRNSCVGALWTKYAYVLLPKKPLSRGTTSHRQELLAVSVGEAERLTVDELVARVRDTYGHSVLHGQRLRHGARGSGRDGTISAVCQGSFYYVLQEDIRVEPGVGEEEGNREENEEQGASALLGPSKYVTMDQQKSQPMHATTRCQPETIATAQLHTTVDRPHSVIPVVRGVPFDPPLEDTLQPSDCRETPSHVENGNCLPVQETRRSSQSDCTGESNPGHSVQQHLRKPFAQGKKLAVGHAHTAENRAISRRYKVKPDPQDAQTAPPLTTHNNCPTSEELPYPIQDGTPPTAPPTSTPLPCPAKEVSLKESIKLVDYLHSLKEQPKECLPPMELTDRKILDKYIFGYSVMPDLMAVNEKKQSNGQKEGMSLGKGGNGYVYKARYQDRVFAVKKTKYRPSEIQLWKTLCHPNLLPLLALQYQFPKVGPVVERTVEPICWAFMPIMKCDLHSILFDTKPLVVRLGTVKPSEATKMMGNAKHILREMLKGLQALHNLGLVHRDIKEHNILLSSQCDCQDVFMCACPIDRKCEVAIADFDSIAREGAKCNSWHGTYGYHAPEAYTPATVSSSLDVWAFGVIVSKVFLGWNLDKQKRDAAMLSFSKNEAEVVVPQLALRDLLSYRAEEVHNAAMFVRECLEVDGTKRKTASELLNLPFIA